MNTAQKSSKSAAAAPPDGFHRLAPKSSVRRGFLFAAIFTTCWIGFFVLMFIGWNNADKGSAPPPLWFIALFGVITLGLIFWCIKSFLRWTMTGQTTVDVNTASAIPGETLEVLVSQPGQFAIDNCNVDLVCQESATYTAGTDTETKTEIVRTIPVCELTGVTAANGQTITRQGVLVPADAMLSFNSSNNKIEWLIRVKMTITRRPDSEQLFPIRVLSRQIVETEAANHG